MIQANKQLLDMYLIENALLGNSITISVGDAVIIKTASPSAVIGAAGTTGKILGTVRAIKNGPASGSTYLQKNTVTTGASNETVDKISVDILPTDVPTTYVADLDDPAGTTTNSQYFGYFDLSGTNNGVLDESSYSASVAKQFLSYGVNPGNQSQVIGIWSAVARS